MKTFIVENTRKGQTIKVTLHNPPYENENILYKTKWKENDCIINEVKIEVDLDDYPSLDHDKFNIGE